MLPLSVRVWNYRKFSRPRAPHPGEISYRFVESREVSRFSSPRSWRNSRTPGLKGKQLSDLDRHDHGGYSRLGVRGFTLILLRMGRKPQEHEQAIGNM